jgi:polyhydroxybutyrate depolymerase
MRPASASAPASALVCAVLVAAVACGGGSSSGGAGPGGDDGSSGGSSGANPDGSTGGGDDGPAPDPTPGCGPAVSSKGFVGSQKITVGGDARTYGLYVPDAYDGKTSYPIVLVFHGDGGTGDEIRADYGQGLEKESGGGALFAYPDGEGTTWQTDDIAGVTKDTSFVDAIIAELQKKYCTDKKRVFLTGFSRGAYFANQAACRTKSTLRAVATHAGGGPFGVQDSEFDSNGNLVCPSPPVGALQVHGEDDGPSEGMKSRDYWRAANTCQQSTSAYDPSPCVSYNGCAQGRPEVWCLIPGLGHQIWSEGVHATWGFFKSF